jgi:hypothetical protein
MDPVTAAAAAKGAATAARGAAKVAKPWGTWIRERLNRRDASAPTVDESIAEAAQQRLGYDAKIQSGLEGVYLQQLHQIAQDEIDDVRKLKAKHLGGGPVKIGGTPGPSGGNHSDLILADRMEFNYPNPSPPARSGFGPVLGVLAGMAAGLAGAIYGPRLLNQPPIVPTVQASPPAAPQAPAAGPATPTINVPNVSVDDLKLRVRWRMDPATGKLKTEVIEQK